MALIKQKQVKTDIVLCKVTYFTYCKPFKYNFSSSFAAMTYNVFSGTLNPTHFTAARDLDS